MDTKRVAGFRVVANHAYNPSMHCLVLQAEEPLLPLRPGQFVNVAIPGNRELFLRRPFSVFDADPGNRTLTLLVKVLGRGSLTLTKVVPGELLSLVYPLGRGFTMPAAGEKVLAIGGGSGVAPVVFLARRAGLAPGRMVLLMGAKTAADHLPPGTPDHCSTLCYTTEDGSLGEKGFVTDHTLCGDLSSFDRIYACGPLPMMKAVAALASLQKVPCEVSLENTMACGFGVCLCCIEPTVHGNLCVCTDGPVFNSKDLLW